MIQYVQNEDINFSKWDACINQSHNALIYAKSDYLTHIASQFDALIYKDYEAVMPLVWKRKYGLYYIYQPAFLQQIGVFSANEISESFILDFLNHIPKKFKLIRMNLNAGNTITNDSITLRKNYILNLSKSYEDISKGFNSNTKRNIEKAKKEKLQIVEDVSPDELINLKKQSSPNQFPDHFFSGIHKYISNTLNREKHRLIGIRNNEKRLISACFFAYAYGRWTYIMAAADEEGKEKRAAFLLVDEFIKQNCDKNNVLDFEGSEIPGIERFFKGFGAVLENYYQYYENRLPFFLKMLTK
jgi:hypothetical protein